MTKENSIKLRNLRAIRSVLEDYLLFKTIIICISDSNDRPECTLETEPNSTISKMNITIPIELTHREQIDSYNRHLERFHNHIKNDGNFLMDVLSAYKKEFSRFLENEEKSIELLIKNLPEAENILEVLDHFRLDPKDLQKEETITIKRSTSRDIGSGLPEEPERITNDS